MSGTGSGNGIPGVGRGGLDPISTSMLSTPRFGGVEVHTPMADSRALLARLDRLRNANASALGQSGRRYGQAPGSGLSRSILSSSSSAGAASAAAAAAQQQQQQQQQSEQKDGQEQQQQRQLQQQQEQQQAQAQQRRTLNYGEVSDIIKEYKFVESELSRQRVTNDILKTSVADACGSHAEALSMAVNCINAFVTKAPGLVKDPVVAPEIKAAVGAIRNVYKMQDQLVARLAARDVTLRKGWRLPSDLRLLGAVSLPPPLSPLFLFDGLDYVLTPTFSPPTVDRGQRCQGQQPLSVVPQANGSAPGRRGFGRDLGNLGTEGVCAFVGRGRRLGHRGGATSQGDRKRAHDACHCTEGKGCYRTAAAA